MTSQDLVIGQKYKFAVGSPVLDYAGKEGNWYTFRELGTFGVWAELLDSDLYMIEGVK